MLGIKHPIIQGGMMWVSDAEFAASVSNSGALGIITAMSFFTPEAVRKEIVKMRGLTDRPFGLNISMLPEFAGDGDFYREFFEVAASEKVPVVETSGRSPEKYLKLLRDAGVKVIHKVPAVRYAKKAEAIGADLVEIVGFECGGHPGMDDVPTAILIQRAVKELKIPVIAGGGFATGSGLASALAMGAQGVVIGTGFMATRECRIHENIKKRIIASDETSTLLICGRYKNKMRVMNNLNARKILEMENSGASFEEVYPLVAGKLGLEAYGSGDTDSAAIACGQAAGLIDEILPVKDFVEKIVNDAEAVISGLQNKIVRG